MRGFRLALWIALAAVMALAGCQKEHSVAASPAAAPVPAALAKAESADYYQASGPIVVENQVDVAAQREGVVAKVLAEPGTLVHKGQLLAQLDDRQLLADREAADAKARSIEADAKNWESEMKVVETDLDRAEEMWKAKLITQQQVEHARYKLQGSKFELERERESARNARAMLRSLELELEKTRITAPFDGVVARRYVRAGQKVAANDRLFWVTATSPMLVKFTLPQEFSGRVRRGEQIMLTSPALGDERHTAKVTLVSPVVDPSSGTIEVQAELTGAPGGLRPGMTANVCLKNAQ